jgi:hypothetical protein
MLTLLLALSVSQAPIAQDFTAPPMTSADVTLTRSARLVERQPRVSTGALIGKMAISTALGLVGSSLGVALTAGTVALASSSGGYFGAAVGLAGAAALVMPLGVGLAIVGVALGAAFLGNDFAKDFGEAMSVAGFTVPLATALVFALLLMSVPPLLAIAVPFLAATITTPLIVQSRKAMPVPERTAAPIKEAVPMNGLVFQL